MDAALWSASNDPVAMMGILTRSPEDTPELISPRKKRLYACALVRQAWHLMEDPVSRRAIEVAERYADGEANEEDRRKALEGLYNAGSPSFLKGSHLAVHCCFPSSFRQDMPLSELLGNAVERCPLCGGRESQHLRCPSCHDTGTVLRIGKGPVPPARQAATLRDLVGNPFRPVNNGKPLRFPINRATPAQDEAFRIAHEAYRKRLPDGSLDPTRLGVMADALEEAGCTDRRLLDHLRPRMAGAGEDGLLMAFNEDGTVRPLQPHFRGCWAVDLVLGKE